MRTERRLAARGALTALRRGRGRPPKAEPRELNVGFKVTAREYQYLQALAWQERTSSGAVVRRLALAGRPPVPRPPPRRQGGRTLRREGAGGASRTRLSGQVGRRSAAELPP